MPRALVWMASCFALLAAFVLPQWGAWRSSQLQAQEAERLSERAPASRIAAEWSSGGTLHDVRVAEWMAASAQNQLATAADWALAFPSVRVAVTASRKPASLLPYARAMRSCVSDAATDEDARAASPRTADIAAACAVLLNWITPET
jgi:type II secretory pathway pseudopilin PulG